LKLYWVNLNIDIPKNRIIKPPISIVDMDIKNVTIHPKILDKKRKNNNSKTIKLNIIEKLM